MNPSGATFALPMMTFPEGPRNALAPNDKVHPSTTKLASERSVICICSFTLQVESKEEGRQGMEVTVLEKKINESIKLFYNFPSPPEQDK